jgi:hypothetical protein
VDPNCRASRPSFANLVLTRAPTNGLVKRCGSNDPMSRPMDPDELRRRASRYRDIARNITDACTIAALLELADYYEALADQAQACEADNPRD